MKKKSVTMWSIICRGRYVQKGYGLGGIFGSVAKVFSPLARNVVRAVNNREVKNILKTVGEEAMDTGEEFLISSLKSESVQLKMKDKINISKKRIADSIEESIAAFRLKRKYMKYDPLIEHLSEEENLQNYKNDERKKRVKYAFKSKVIRRKEIQSMDLYSISFTP